MPVLSHIPLFEKLRKADNILIAGAGGGFDFYSGLPLYFALKNEGKNIHLANLSFTWLAKTNATLLYHNCYEVEAQHRDFSTYNYFPEKFLCEWFLTLNQQVKVYAFAKTGVKPLKKSYEFLVKKLNIDAIILIDGGTDSLMFGDEDGLGTPEEDSCSIAAVHQVKVPQKYLVCLGFGVDHFHGVSHYRFLENVSKISQEGGYLGCFPLLPEMNDFKKYRSAVEYSNQRMKQYPSIVSNSIVSAVEGHYGNYHRTYRTNGSKLWINPLMAIYWCFELKNIAQNLLYYDDIKHTEDFNELVGRLSGFRAKQTERRPNKQIPI